MQFQYVGESITVVSFDKLGVHFNVENCKRQIIGCKVAQPQVEQGSSGYTRFCWDLFPRALPLCYQVV
jgi:hypothetical protein